MRSDVKNKAEILLALSLDELIAQANSVRAEFTGDKLELCSILNAKSGLCSEDCKFCAQSSRHCANVQVYPLKAPEQIVKAAKQAKKIGAEKFGIVTSGNRLNDSEVDVITQAVVQISRQVGIDICASLGALEEKQLKALKEAGLSRYHHNIETSRRFYPQIVSTHSFDERINTIYAAKQAGLEVCSGGIIGMGETWADRIDMAYTLKKLDVDSIPINILVPFAGTALEDSEMLSVEDILRTICIFRIILKDKTIKIAAGREAVLKESQIDGFKAGANGMLIGGYLTVGGAELSADYALIEEIKGQWRG